MSAKRVDSDGGDGATPQDLRFPLDRPPAQQSSLVRLGHAPLLWVTLYYVSAVLIAASLTSILPLVHEAWMAPTFPAVSEGAAVLSGSQMPTPQPVSPVRPEHRILMTLLVIVGAIGLAVPVAWVYMITKRLRFDPGLVRSVIILPIAVAGILLVVKNSLAIAFSLAGIVAAVRFRNTLKDPQDAVYVFLAIAIGIAAGVQALDVALVVSVLFNLTVLGMWKLQVGSVYAGRYGKTGVLSIGDSALLVAQSPENIRAVRRQVLERGEEIEADGILLVHSIDLEVTRQTVQDALGQAASDWRLLAIYPRGSEVYTAEYLIRLDKDSTAADLMGSLDDWSAQINAAEYIPYRQRAQERPEGDSDLKPS